MNLSFWKLKWLGLMTSHKVLSAIITVYCASFSCSPFCLLFILLFLGAGFYFTDQDLGLKGDEIKLRPMQRCISDIGHNNEIPDIDIGHWHLSILGIHVGMVDFHCVYQTQKGTQPSISTKHIYRHLLTYDRQCNSKFSFILFCFDFAYDFHPNFGPLSTFRI